MGGARRGRRPARPLLECAPLPVFVDSLSDQPPSGGLFRSWPRLYAAVLGFAVLIWIFLFFFSRAFRGS